MSVKAFLEGLAPQRARILSFVTGNQSADMDSVVSAITYAYFHHQAYPKGPPLYPLVNITREELQLRRDIVLLLKSHSISDKNLYFLEDVEELTKNDQSVELVLVDHCNLQGELLTRLYEEKRLNVVGIVDHHADEGVFMDASPRIIQSNGSCSSLVFNYWNDKINDKARGTDVILLLLGPLVIDTSNMTQKVEENDVTAFREYQKVLESGPTELQTDILVSGVTPEESFYKTLKAAKKDLSGFFFFDVLRKDYKQFVFTSQTGQKVSIGFSSLGKSMAWVLKKYSKDEIVSTFDKMVKVFHLDIVLMTTSFTKAENGEYTREFCYHATRKDLEGLGASVAQRLELNSDIYGGDKVTKAVEKINRSRAFRIYNQLKITASRKQVVPVVKDAVEEGKLI